MIPAWAGALALAVTGARADEATVRRFALLAGANDGGPERVPLVYAGTDARTMAGVLARYGGVDPADITVLEDPVRLELEAAFSEMAARIQAAEADHRRTEVVVYYSGHSDAKGLLLSGGQMSYTDLRASLDALPADVRVAILDSCSSGALVRGKGGVAVPGFLVEEGSDVEGHAFLTSSSADEISQEADALGGSFFTHALVTGLRGGADTDLDGQVTLNEAYRFAYDETLARTEGTRYGPQHAAYDIQLSGSGDLVMTDLRQRTAALELGSAVQGLVMVRDDAGRLVAELRKPPGRPVLLSLDPGGYTVTARSDSGTFRARAQVAPHSVAELEQSDFSGFLLADARARGDVDEVVPRIVPMATMLVPEWPLVDRDDPEVHQLSIGLLATSAWGLDGAAVALGGTFVAEDARGAQLSVGANVAGGAVDGFQGAAGANIAGGHVEGGQGASGGNFAGSLQGFQGAAGVNLVSEEARGLQAAAGANVAERLHGAQLSAGANIAGQAQGLQAGVVNVSRGGDDRGLKLGIVNVSGHLTGGSVGLINAADSIDGAPFGLINIVKDGIFDVEFWGDSTGTYFGGLKTGSSRIYTLLAVGAESTRGLSGASNTGPDSSDEWRVAGGLALGGRLASQRPLSADIDVGAWTWTDVSTGATTLVPRLRVAGGWRPLKQRGFALFAGADANLAIPLSDSVRPQSVWGDGATATYDSGLAFWPGLFAGVRF